ncbi:cysteine protease [Malassezia cuniculi]|uniref:Cysteine protease n=1 Tax=Malassezia cuniculi TaxID=948313 RepID=A0AAF0EQG1_9BASI|nr:cysteine protease [Malassezia cuniculi]
MLPHLRTVAARAVEREMAGDYDGAFKDYTDVVQQLLDSARSSPSGVDARSMAARLLARAERVAGKRGRRSRFAAWDDDCASAPAGAPEMSASQKKSGAAYMPLDQFLYAPAAPGDVCQGSASDCTIVASIETAAAHDARFGTNFASAALYPQRDGVPVGSDVYDVRLFFDGEPRKVTVNSEVPAAQGEIQGCHLRNGSPWPALIEKAFLHVYSSSYDHAGGDAGSDVYMLTGWLPEYIALQETHATVHGLISGHCYSIAALDGGRTVTLINPWKDAADPVIRCSWDDLCVSFSVLSVNWDPASWTHSTNVRGSWKGNAADASVQYRLTGNGPVTLHLERHIDSQDSFIAVHAFHSDGRVFNVVSGGQMGTYTDARHSLIRVDAPCTVIVSQSQGGDASYTLSAYSDAPVSLEDAVQSLEHSHILCGAWRARSAGGNVNYATFRHNPQFTVRVGSSDATMLPRLRALVHTNRDVAVSALLVRGGQRVCQVSPASVVACSGAYSRGIALCDASAVQPGVYTLVLSTFTPQEADFSLQVESSAETLAIDTIPPEGAGMYHRGSSGSSWKLHLEAAATVAVHFHGQAINIASAHGHVTTNAGPDASDATRSPIPPPAPARVLTADDMPLVWIDCEMSGLEDHDCLLEVAVIVTDGNLVPVDEGVSYVIRTPKEVLDAMGEWCASITLTK